LLRVLLLWFGSVSAGTREQEMLLTRLRARQHGNQEVMRVQVSHRIRISFKTMAACLR
jgi:hypothetical protein